MRNRTTVLNSYAQLRPLDDFSRAVKSYLGNYSLPIRTIEAYLGNLGRLKRQDLLLKDLNRVKAVDVYKNYSSSLKTLGYNASSSTRGPQDVESNRGTAVNLYDPRSVTPSATSDPPLLSRELPAAFDRSQYVYDAPFGYWLTRGRQTR